MKLFLFLFAVSLYSPSLFANDLDKQINKACLRHAVSLVAQLKSDVVDGMSQEQSDQALKIIDCWLPWTSCCKIEIPERN